MMLTRIFWINGPWKGRLALSARPRGGDWLEDEIAAWREAGIDLILSHLTREEESDLDLLREKQEVVQCGMRFISFPVPDRETPGSVSEALSTFETLNKALSEGKNSLVHCRQGIGRAALSAVCLLILKGISVDEALRIVSDARGVQVPETEAQRCWIDDFDSRLVGTSTV
jgi:protein-tyrosine phosphatase